MTKNVDTFRGFLGMKALMLFDEDRHASYRENGSKHYQGYNKAEDNITYQEG